MKVRRFKPDYRETASNLHIQIGNVLRSSPLFKYRKIYQEYPADRINPRAPARYKFDWVVLDLKLVIEVHGQQHYKAVCFGGTELDSIEASYYDIKYRDKVKKRLAEEAGFSYIEIPFDEIDQVNDNYIWSKYVSTLEE